MDKIKNITIKDIQKRIFNIRDIQVMVDSDLAEFYKVKTKVLNQAVKRNKDRFPKKFMFQLTEKETNELVTNCDRFDKLKYSTTTPKITNINIFCDLCDFGKLYNLRRMNFSK